MPKLNQQTLSQNQIQAFYHDDFVESQVRDFDTLLKVSVKPLEGTIIDIGGGAGFFAKAIQERLAVKVSVLDSDAKSVFLCHQAGIEAIQGDALNPLIIDTGNVVCFNLILHHLVGKSEDETLSLQSRALTVWHPTAWAIFIHEYIYESYVINDFSARLIFRITSSPILSYAADIIAKYVPSLKANTFGVGVRFRSYAEWRRIFSSLGFDIVETVKGEEEGVSLARRLLLIKNCRRDSFLLKPSLTK
jgi:hypothetical protein